MSRDDGAKDKRPIVVIKVGTSSLLKTNDGCVHLSQLCALCETVSVNPRAAASARHGSMRDPFDLFALAARRSASGRDMAYARCDGCRSMLAYAAGSTAVRCAACGTVTRTHSSETPAAAATSGGDTGRARVQGARLTRENLVVIENPPTVTANGKIRSNIAVGVKLDE